MADHGDSQTNNDQTIARLELALEAEKQRSAGLREELAGVQQQLDGLESRLEARLEERIAEIKARAEKAEAKLKDQNERLEVLARGREEGMLALNNARDELRLVAIERDELRKQLTAVEGMQTETVAFSEESREETSAEDALPSIEELMANLSQDEAEPEGGVFPQGKAEAPEADEGEWQEMISPDLIVADPVRGNGRAIGGNTRLLVSLDSDPVLKYPLDQELMTIGRSESADIQISGNFISRIHTRLLTIGADTVIEDAGSKNGTRVNSERIDRHVLEHGDLIRIGTARFRFVDQSAED